MPSCHHILERNHAFSPKPIVPAPVRSTGAVVHLAMGLTQAVYVQTHVFDKAAGGGGAEGGGGSNGMTRVAGASLAALSAYAMDAGLTGNNKQRNMAYKITAGHSAVGAGVYF